MPDNSNSADFLRLTTEILSAHLRNNTVALSELPALTRAVYDALKKTLAEGTVPEAPRPAVPIRRSVTADYIVCLEDGRKLKMLKRHLKTAYGLTPEDYRKRWGLPPDYPMVAPSYARQRSGLAKRIGLGRQRRRG